MKELFNLLFEADLFTQEEHRLLLKTIAARGKNKGDLRATLPKGDEARGAWRSVMSHCALNRAGLFGLMFASPEEVAAFDATEAAIKRVFGSAAAAHHCFGVLQPLRFNLVAHHCGDVAAPELAAFICAHHKRGAA